MKRFIGFVSAFVLAGLIVLAVVAGFAVQAYQKAGTTIEDKLLYIESGQSARAIARDLKQLGFLDKTGEYLFLGAVRLGNKSLKAGEYNIPARASIADVVSLLDSGKTYQRYVTVAEGLTSTEIVALLNEEPALTGTIEEIPPEGTLLPETYSYSYGDKRQDVLRRMQTALDTALQQEWENRQDGLPYKSPAEAVIMASIIEKETGVAAEREKVAGVFVNRLETGMMLQSDPTVIYALTHGKAPLERALTRMDWKVESPYNTYKITGLPPTPIANPGLKSIHAALNPADHDYFYFVADGTGGHAFAKTLKEHNNNVIKWRRIRDGG